MTEQLEQWICIKFCIKHEHSSSETIQMIQKATSMDNGWLAASSQQCAYSCSKSHAAFLSKYQIIQVSPDLQPRFGALWLLAFPKTKINFEREEISDCRWDSRKHNRAAKAIERTVCGPKVPTLKGTETSLSYYNITFIFFNKYLYFSYYVDGYLWTDLVLVKFVMSHTILRVFSLFFNPFFSALQTQ